MTGIEEMRCWRWSGERQKLVLTCRSTNLSFLAQDINSTDQQFIRIFKFTRVLIQNKTAQIKSLVHTSPLPAILTVSATTLITSPHARRNNPDSIPHRTSSTLVTVAPLPACAPPVPENLALLRLLIKRLTTGIITNTKNSVVNRLVVKYGKTAALTREYVLKRVPAAD